MNTRIALVLCALLVSSVTGCAALSLFGETHTHTHHHHHDCSDAELQKRLGRIESRLSIQHAEALKPTPMQELR